MSLTIGIYNLGLSPCGGGEKRTLALAEHWSRRHRVLLLVSEPPDVPALERYFGVDLSRSEIVPLGTSVPVKRIIQRKPRGLLADILRFREIRTLGLDVFVNIDYGSLIGCPAPRGIYQCMFPQPVPRPLNTRSRLRRLAHRVAWQLSWRALGCDPCTPNSYTVVAANSQFTSHWIEEMWGLDSTVVYSVCDSVGAGGTKEKVILNIGRFDPRKKQDVLIEAFRRAPSLHRNGWQLHLAGSKLEHHAEYMARLKQMAEGLPVVFHPGIAFNELQSLYRRAAIYWHAKGYGTNPASDPEAQEHFGIVTGEAMSAGAVPVVINTGGQPEIVTHEKDGFVWDTPEQLLSYTCRLADDEPLCRQMSEAALAAGTRFNRAAFAARLDALLEQVMERGSAPAIKCPPPCATSTS